MFSTIWRINSASLNTFFSFALLLILLSFFLTSTGEILQSLIVALFSFWDFFLYLMLPTATVTLAASVMLAKNPINSLFCLIGVFLTAILLLLSIRVEFLSMIFLIVYLGAIAILFLFVIMLLNLRNLNYQKLQVTPRNLFICFLVFVLSFQSYFYLTKGVYLSSYYNLKMLSFFPFQEQAIYQMGHGFNDIFLFSALLYTEHWTLLLLSGMLLLAAMIGSIVLAISTVEEENE